MNMKLNITRILSLSVLLLLPAFAAAGQRKAVKKAALPKLTSDGSGFRAFTKPAAGAERTTTQDAVEASGTGGNGAQSTGGAGVSAGVGIGQAPGGVQNTGTFGSGSGSGAAGGSGGTPFSAGNSAAKGYWCVSDAGHSNTQLGTRLVYNGAGPAPAMGKQACRCENVDISESGLTRHRKMSRGEAISFSFVTDGSERVGAFETGMDTSGATVSRFMTLSEYPCDFSYAGFDSKNGCAGTGHYSAGVAFKVGQVDFSACQLKPNTRYYLNVRNENPSTGDVRHPNSRGQDTCEPGNTCGFVFGPQFGGSSNSAAEGVSAGTGATGNTTPAAEQCNALMCSGGSLQLTSYHFSPPPPACGGKSAGQACSSGEGCLLSQPTACH